MTLFDMMHSLVGCRWGWVCSTPDDRDKCFEQAVAPIVVLHTPEGERELRLCAKHQERLSHETTPREGEE